MKLKKLFMAVMLITLAAAPALAAETPARERLQELTIGFAIGKGFVAKSDSEIAALQYRVEFRRQRIYLAFRGSWVAQECNSRPNPKESSLLAGMSLPVGSKRQRINLGLGIGKTSIHGTAAVALPCEVRLKSGVFALTAFANFNRSNSFYGFCAGLDIPIWVLKSQGSGQ
jgi:hypothetical protein